MKPSAAGMDTAKMAQYNRELEQALKNFDSYHSDMERYRQFYKNSAVYEIKSGNDKQKNERKINLLKVFANKNIFYTSPEPIYKVPTTGADPQMRKAASIREKIIYAVRRKSNSALLRAKWAFDATIFSVAISETYGDIKGRCAYLRRLDPRSCFWQWSSDSEPRVEAFWSISAITKQAAMDRFGVTPTANLVSTDALKDKTLSKIDGKDWFIMAMRWDDNNRAVWIGNVWVEVPHNHNMGVIPIDICMPFEEGDADMFGSFFLADLIAPQAELNDTLKRRSNIVRRMSNPVIWGRGIIQKQFDDVKRDLKSGGGGFVGLKQQGELGVLSVNDTKMLSEHRTELIEDMMRLAGFGPAAFGEPVGANTSGDALGMYFTPTQRAIDHQNISWVAFDQSINSKILRWYDRFLKTGETVKLDGYSPTSTLLPVESVNEGEESKLQYSTGGFDVQFDKTVIAGNYTSISMPRPVTPKDELAYKRLLYEAASGTSPSISRTTMYEEWGMLSPEDELALLQSEQSDPVLNPTLMNAGAKLAPQLGQPPMSQNVAPEGTPLPTGNGVA